MAQDLWNSFPRLLEEKINTLLDEAEPNKTKAFHLYKACSSDGAWNGSFNEFQIHLYDFFNIHKNNRRKSHIDKLLERPISSAVFEQFELTFKTADISLRKIINLANWSYNLIRINKKIDTAYISTDVFTKSIQKITQPNHLEKDNNIEFSDFSDAWRRICFQLFGRKYDNEVNSLIQELSILYHRAKSEEENLLKNSTKLFPKIYLTQTEIDWLKEILECIDKKIIPPDYPLSRGTDKIRLQELQRTLQLHRIILSNAHQSLSCYSNQVIATLKMQCQQLLVECAK